MSEHPSDNDKQLFRQAVDGVRRLKTDRVQLIRPKPPMKPRSSDSLEPYILNTNPINEFDSGVDIATDEISFSRPGIQKQTLRKLRQGRFTIEAKLDLHGLTVEQARQALISFIHQCCSENIRYACIIHGKGRSSTQEHGILKINTHRWLQKIDAVLAIYSARPRDGGTGAVYVLLKCS